ncbi:CBF/NF-Y family transcription factor [Akanthomyces lecanii RCEF 1005]|uniref:NCT transcriptional regulatory complex subunit B n=1 Tax=Akanthomyces lecanii RCEF 1005 TaxID=1081108 RepID=A0A168IEV9_CORDF|nr:CBF/NF-Y family transcription factor [Akanthomyces lecanii RCEF 1005]
MSDHEFGGNDDLSLPKGTSIQTADAANKQETRISVSLCVAMAFPSPPTRRDKVPNLCKATVQKIVTEILPPSAGVAFARESRDLLIECCVEFITLISSEANEISEKEAKKTIACDHITKALEQLGFSDYVPAVMEAAAEHKEVQKGREKKSDKFANSGMSMEELARLQEEQFAQARQRHG